MKAGKAGKLMYQYADDDLKEKLYQLCVKVRKERNPRTDSEWTLNGLLHHFGLVWEAKEDVKYPK